MRLDDFIRTTGDAITVQRVFGESYSQDGTTVIPAASVKGGGGGGGGNDKDGQQGEGGGFGLQCRPAGAYVIKGGEVRWMPAWSSNRPSGRAASTASTRSPSGLAALPRALRRVVHRELIAAFRGTRTLRRSFV